MKRSTLLLALGAGAMAVVLTSCSSGTEETTTTTTAAPTTPGVSVLVSDSPNSDNCVACHTDENSLKSLAVEPVEENLNEGEG